MKTWKDEEILKTPNPAYGMPPAEPWVRQSPREFQPDYLAALRAEKDWTATSPEKYEIPSEVREAVGSLKMVCPACSGQGFFQVAYKGVETGVPVCWESVCECRALKSFISDGTTPSWFWSGSARCASTRWNPTPLITK